MRTYPSVQAFMEKASSGHYNKRERELINGRSAHDEDLAGLAKKLLQNEELLRKELASRYPDATVIARLQRIIAKMEKYRDPNLKAR